MRAAIALILGLHFREVRRWYDRGRVLGREIGTEWQPWLLLERAPASPPGGDACEPCLVYGHS